MIYVRPFQINIACTPPLLKILRLFGVLLSHNTTVCLALIQATLLLCYTSIPKFVREKRYKKYFNLFLPYLYTYLILLYILLYFFFFSCYALTTLPLFFHCNKLHSVYHQRKVKAHNFAYNGKWIIVFVPFNIYKMNN